MGRRLKIERRGGVAGMVARGEIDEELLSAEERQLLDKLFESRMPAPPAPGVNRFRYLVTREDGRATCTIEIPEHLVPRSIANVALQPFR